MILSKLIVSRCLSQEITPQQAVDTICEQEGSAEVLQEVFNVILKSEDQNTRQLIELRDRVSQTLTSRNKHFMPYQPQEDLPTQTLKRARVIQL